MQNFDEIVTRLGHRNWIAIVDAAFPEMTSPGVTLLTGGQLERVVASVLEAKHVRFDAFVDSELEFVSEEDAPGVGAFRKRLHELLGAETVRPLPHDELIAMLDQAGQTFRVVVVKTDVLIPYTSLFLRLDCGYWDADSETRLRSRLQEKTPCQP